MTPYLPRHHSKSKETDVDVICLFSVFNIDIWDFDFSTCNIPEASIELKLTYLEKTFEMPAIQVTKNQVLTYK